MLHAHLPFVRHPEEEYFLEENWLFEAITETYLPLLDMFERLSKDKIDFRLTMSLTPPLISMLKDELLQQRYIRHINKLIELTEKEIIRTKFENKLNSLAILYNKQLKHLKSLYLTKYKTDIVNAFNKFQKKGVLEIITCCATHGYLPILKINNASTNAQIKIGVDYYKKVFDKNPLGIWLPECGFYEGVDKKLKDHNIKYFFMDSHGIVHGNPTPRYGVYAPVYCPSGVAAFGRDTESSKQVWSAKEGYPGDYDYREYYKDIGHELDFDYIKPYIHPLGIRINTGIKYWRITGQTDQKDYYNPQWAKDKAASHAGNFLFNRQKQIGHLAHHMDRPPIVVAPYDAELFGHWWHEGPMWLEFLIRKIYHDQSEIKLITPSEYLEGNPTNQVIVPSESSWGYKGYHEFWIDGVNDWIYRHTHIAAERLQELSKTYNLKPKRTIKNSLLKRALNQAARELLLAESSDWPFIMKAGTMVQYANKRVNQHIGRFTKLYNDIKNDSIDKIWLTEIEKRDNIFNDLDCINYYNDNPN